MEPETIDISLGAIDEAIEIPKSTSNFGGGIELLMNEKVKESSSSSKPGDNIDIDDLNDLENDLNNLAEDVGLDNSFKAKSELFSSDLEDVAPSVTFNDPEPIKIGVDTANIDDDQKTWDGFSKFNEIPVNPDAASTEPAQPKMTKEELLREKFALLRKLEALEKKGVELSKKYTMESSLLEMQGEYETIMDEKAKANSIKFQANMMMACINGIEFLNGRFDPFDIKLDGWGEQVNENISDYDEIFGELHDKYKSKATMAPELKLLFQLGGSAMMVHMTNTLFKSSLPNMDDIMRQNPDLMAQFQSAAVNSMGQSNPGFAGFMNGMMNPEPQPGPPPPMATQTPGPPPDYINNSRSRPGNNSSSFARSSVVNDGINIRESEPGPPRSSRRAPDSPPQKSSRPEMKGPSDISDILSGLKTKTINIQEAAPPAGPTVANDSSTISIADLKELQTDGALPKKSKRRKESAKNTISLDI
tara:strand:+ start:21942 stop:23366 length:1425 start_codon:yes stop_codon:yes gene_type:complete